MGDRLTVAERAAKAGTVRISGKRGGKGKKKGKIAMGNVRTAGKKGGAKAKPAAAKKTLPKYGRFARRK